MDYDLMVHFWVSYTFFITVVLNKNIKWSHLQWIWIRASLQQLQLDQPVTHPHHVIGHLEEGRGVEAVKLQIETN